MNDDPVTHWAMVTRKLKDARKAKLEELGISEDGLRALEQMALTHIEESMVTEYGVVQKIPDKPVQFTVRRSTDPSVQTMNKRKLILLTKEG